MREGDIAPQWPKERDARTDEHRNPGDDEPVNQAGLKELLNGDPAIHVDVLDSAVLELRHNLGGRAAHPLDYGTRRSGRDRMTAEHKHRLFTVRPLIEAQGCLERLAADDQRIHRDDEVIVSVRFATTWREKIEGAVRSSNKPVEARADKDRCLHTSFLRVVDPQDA